MRKLILQNGLSPGDILMLTAAVRDLHLSQPGLFQTDVRTPCPEFWENNPYLTPLCETDPDVETIHCDYPLIHQSNQLPYHFIHGFRRFLCERLGVDIRPSAFKGDIHISDLEKSWLSQVDEITGEEGTRFWIIVSGGKKDFTAKWWDPARCQAVVDHFRGRIQFVQCGDGGDFHVHPPLEHVINLVGQTDLRQATRLMYHAEGVICPVTMFMHLAAAVETRGGRSRNRPCVVIAGGREPVQWESYPYHQFLHTNGCLPCCDDGGCWKSHVVPLADIVTVNMSLNAGSGPGIGTAPGMNAVPNTTAAPDVLAAPNINAALDLSQMSLCERPVRLASGRMLPQCLDMITATDVITAVEKYLAYET